MWAWFVECLKRAPRLTFYETDEGWYALYIVLPFGFVCVGTDMVPGTHVYSPDCPFKFLGQVDYQFIGICPSGTTRSAFMIAYSDRFYLKDGILQYGELIDYVAVSSSTDTDLKFFDRFQGVIARAYEDAGRPKKGKSGFFDRFDSVSDDFNMLVNGTWSAQNWPELEGIRTQYIDNVGVFIPDWCDIDYNLSHSLGSDMVALRVVREPNSQVEQSRFGWDAFRRWMEFLLIGQGGAGANASGQATQQGGGIASAIIGTYNFGMSEGQVAADQLRLIFPRLRAFGRQETVPLNYDALVQRVKSVLGSDGWQSKDGTIWKQSYSKFVSIPTRATIDAFINTVTGAATSTGTFNRLMGGGPLSPLSDDPDSVYEPGGERF